MTSMAQGKKPQPVTMSQALMVASDAIIRSRVGTPLQRAVAGLSAGLLGAVLRGLEQPHAPVGRVMPEPVNVNGVAYDGVCAKCDKPIQVGSARFFGPHGAQHCHRCGPFIQTKVEVVPGIKVTSGFRTADEQSEVYYRREAKDMGWLERAAPALPATTLPSRKK